MTDRELLLLAAGVAYGPLLAVTAFALYAASLPPARRRLRPLERLARRPLFWVVVPPLVALAWAFSFFELGRSEALALASGPTVTLTKTTTAHFQAPGSTLSAYTDSSGNQLDLVASLTPSTSMTIGPVAPYLTGDGGHAVEAASGEFLVFHGEGTANTSVLSPISNTFLSGSPYTPSFPGGTKIGKGAFSLPRGDGTFLLIAGGDTDVGANPLLTFIITPPASVGGQWTATAGPNLSGNSGAGNGAHAIKFTDSVDKFLIVHAGGSSGTAGTSIYTPSTNGMVAGPAFASNKKAGKGALAIPRTDGTFLIVLGAGGNDTQIYTVPADGGVGSFAAGPTLAGPTGEGSFAIQYKNAANQDRYAIIRGGTQSVQVYDPAATPATSAGMVTTLSIPNAAHGNSQVGAGGMGFLRADGTVVCFYGGTNDVAFLFTPGSGSEGAFTTLSLTNSLPMERGSFALQQADGKFMVFGGAQVETRINDAGWALKGTYESEGLNPGNVDKWTQIGWTRDTNDLTLEWRSATAKDLLPNSSYTTVTTSGGTSGTATIAPAVTHKWLQVRVTVARPDADSTGAQAKVWLGSDSVVQKRGITATSPILYDYTLQYTSGVFVLSAASPATAGVGFPLTVELRDSADVRIADYQGNHTVTFSGAATAPDAVTKPTVRDRAGVDVAFGSPTGLSFDTSGLAIGTATPRTFLYKREEINVSASETITTPGPFAAFDLSTHTMSTATTAHIVVNAAGPSGTKSTLVASPTNVVPDGVATSTLTATVADAYGNLLPGYKVTVSSSRGSTDTFSKTTLAPSDFDGKTTTTILSSTRGLSSVTGTIEGPPSPVAVAKRYFGTTTTTFRAGPGGSTLWQAPTTAPGSGVTTTTLDFATGIGSRLVKPGVANAAAGSPASSATNFGWRDESYSRSGQDASTSQLSGDFTFTYSLQLTTGTSAVTGQVTVVAYAVDANNTTRELFRSTSRNLSIGQAELNHTHSFTPAYAVLNNVTGGLAANEILQYEFFLNLTANPNSSGSGAVVQLRAGAAGSGLVAPAIEGGGIAASPSTTQSTTITPTTTVSFLGAQQSITLTKSTTTHFDANGTTKSSVVTTGNKIVVAGTPASSVTACSGGGCPGAVGAGGHALAGNGGEFLIVRGGGSTGGSIYSAGSITSSPTIGAIPIGTGGFSLPRGDGSYLLVAGGIGDGGSSPLKTFIVTPAASAGGAWTFSAGPDLAGLTGAGAGAHALARTASQYLLVHGGATAKTSLYTPGTNTMSAGPDLAANAGAGAHSVARDDGTFLVVLGGGSSSTNLYDPVGNGFSAGPSLGAAVGDGGHAIQYTNGSSQARFLLVLGGGSTTTKIYDPAATPAASAGVSSGPAAPAVGVGGHSILRGDGTSLLLAGGGSTSVASFSPTGETLTSGSLTNLSALGAGAHSFHRASDGMFVLVTGNAGTGLASYDAGWALSGTYTTEPLNPGHVDSWNTIGWTVTGATGGTLTVSVRTATVSGGGSYATLASAATATGSAAIGGPVGNRWAQVQLALARVVPASSGAEQGVWLGSSSVAQSRSLGPAVTKLDLGYTSGAFAVAASATQTAGASNTATVTLKDSAGTTISDYTASHTLVFAGASSAPNGTVPTAAGTNFASNTALTFASGAATAALVLYKAETAGVSVSEDSATITPATTYSLSSFQIGTSTTAAIAVSAAAANAANSTMSAVPTAVPADNSTTSLITVTVKDAYQNPISGLGTVTLSSYASVAGDRVSYDTLSTPGATSSAGVTTGTIKSTRFGTVTIAVSVGGSPLAIAPAATVAFGASVFTVATQNGGTETAGTAFTLTLTAKDQSGATVTSYTGSKTLTFTSTASRRTSPGTGPLPVVTSPQTVSFTSGVGTTATGTGSACGQPTASPAIECRFTLYNTAQQPTITATDGAFPTGTTAALVINPGAVSLSVSTLTADPLTVAADAKDTTNITTKVLDAYYNPISGKTVTLTSSRVATDTIIQPPTSDANGLAVGQMHSSTTGTPTITSTVTGSGALAQTVTINFVTVGGATRVLVVRTQNVERETAGVAFSVTINGIKNDGSIDQNFCSSANCTLSVTHTALAAPDGTAPTANFSGSVRFSQGSYTTSANAGNLMTFYRANQDPAPILTVTAVDGPNSIVGVTPAVLVSPNTNSNQYANILAKSYVYSVPDIAPADGTTTVTLGAKVVDNWKNPISDKTVTFTSSRGGTDTLTQSATATGALGLAFGTMKSSTAGAATVTGAITGIGTLTSTAATVSFFGEPGGGRIQNGTRLGSVTNAVAADTPLAMVARDLAGVELDVATPVSWEVSGTGGGTLSTTLTTSGAETPAHSTYFTATRAGTVTVRGGYTIPEGSTGAGTQVNVEVTFKIVSQLDVTAVTTFGRTISARVEYDGTKLRTLSWVTTSP